MVPTNSATNAVTGSAVSSLGLAISSSLASFITPTQSARARAIATRCRWPPDI